MQSLDRFAFPLKKYPRLPFGPYNSGTYALAFPSDCPFHPSSERCDFRQPLLPVLPLPPILMYEFFAPFFQFDLTEGDSPSTLTRYLSFSKGVLIFILPNETGL